MIQWLFVGGPLDGRTAWHDQGVVHFGDVTYTGTNYLCDGRLYRIGYAQESDLHGPRLVQLINGTGLRHLAED